MIKRTIQCNCCGLTYTEEEEGTGFPQWGQLSGIALNNKANPHLCPGCLKKIADFIDLLSQGKRK
jgi:rubredoxin